MAVKIFTQFTSDDFGKTTNKISEGLFTNGVGELNAFYTSSTQAASARGAYAIDVYHEVTSSTTSEVQFSIAYGHISGSGSVHTNDSKPSKAIHSQYRNLLLESDDSQFTFNSVDSNHITVLNVNRNKFKENIDPGNWELHLASGSSVIKLIDDSGQSLGAGTQANSSAAGKKYYNIVSGSVANGPYGSTYLYHGLFYHEMGLLIFNPNSINSALSMSAASSSFITQSTDATPSPSNTSRFYNLMTHVSASVFKARNEETLNSQHFFIRIKSKEYNFSNNPTYITGSQGRIIDTISKRGTPFSFITGIGLYNDSNELLAVAKLSQPLFKEPGTEALVKVRLDF